HGPASTVGRSEEALRLCLARKPPADYHLALELPWAPARVAQAEAVGARVAFHQRLEAVGRDAEEEAVLQLDRIGDVGSAVQEETALGRHRAADEGQACPGMHRKTLLVRDLRERHLAGPAEDDPHRAVL